MFKNEAARSCKESPGKGQPIKATSGQLRSFPWPVFTRQSNFCETIAWDYR